MSEAAKHTPGPWKFSGFMKASNFADHVAVVHGDHCKLATVRGGVRDDKATAEANARLIAAAPEMLAALRTAAETLRSFDGGDQSTETGWRHDELCEAWVQVTDAIARAESTIPADRKE